MDKQLFRKTSLDQLQSPDQLDQLLTVTSLRAWIAFIGIFVVIIAIFIWSLTGSLAVQVYGQGMLISSGGIQQVIANENGKITDISVKPGEMVEEGEVIARIEQPELLEEIRLLNMQMEGHAKDLDLQRQEMEKQLAALQNKLYTKTRIISPFTGKVVEVKAKRGELIQRGTSILSMERTEEQLNKLETVLYVPAESGKKIQPGMEVKIEPSSILKEDFGYLLGRVTKVADFPATFQGMMDTIGNEEIVATLAGQGGAPIEVTVSLIPDQATESGYKWTTSQGPPVAIQSGTLANAMITIEESHPIEKVLQQFN